MRNLRSAAAPLWAIFVLVLAYTFWAATVGWGLPLIQPYDFVQSKAAIVAYYLARGAPILQYEMPLHGAPWSIPYEFPVYQWLSAQLHLLSGLPLEAAGRIVGRGFFYLSCVPLAVIAGALGFRGAAILVPLTLFLASPIYLFWSRQFMIESTATFFGLAYLAAVMAWAQRRRPWLLALAIFVGVAAALAKSTTYATFALAATLYLAYELFRTRALTQGASAETAALTTNTASSANNARLHHRRIGLALLLPALAMLSLPLLTGLAWVKHTDAIKSLNPLAADFHTSAALSKWYLSTDWRERFNSDFFYRLFRITIHDAIGHRAAWILSVLLALALGRRAALYWMGSALFLVAPLLFTHAHRLHDYYANANAIFLVLAVACLIHRAWSSQQKWLQLCAAVLFVATLGYELRGFLTKGYVQQQEVRVDQIDFARQLPSLVAPEEVLLIFGEDWCPMIPYYAERRAIMLWKREGFEEKLRESLRLLAADGKKIGAVVLCHEAKGDDFFLRRPFVGKRLMQGRCDVYDGV